MQTANEELRDAFLLRQVGLLQLSDSVVAELVTLLNGSEPKLRDAVEEFLMLLAAVPLQTRRANNIVQRLERAILSARAKSVEAAQARLVEHLTEIAAAEAEAFGTAMRTVVPVELRLNRPSARRLRVIAEEVSPQGASVGRWFEGIAANEARLIAAEVAAGAAAGDSPSEIVSRIVGTRSAQGADGLTQATRTHVDAVVRTSITQVADLVRQDMAHANADIIDEEMWVATLDSRTTPYCRAQDGHRYPVGEGPRPPAHWRCRSIRVPIIDGVVIGQRPMKAATEQMLRREWNGRGRFRDFARRRTRELTGTVPAETTYQQWLSRQSADIQDDILGPARGALFRRGGVTLDRFVNFSRRKEWTLAELAQREAAAFRRAGLDLRSFR